MSPAELLARAADHIRDVAAKATPGPWGVEYDYTGTTPQAVFRMDPGHPDDPDFSATVGAMDAADDNQWVVLIQPAVAPHLETILRQFIPLARSIEQYGSDWTWLDDHQVSAYRAAVELAKVMLADVETKETM